MRALTKVLDWPLVHQDLFVGQPLHRAVFETVFVVSCRAVRGGQSLNAVTAAARLPVPAVQRWPRV